MIKSDTDIQLLMRWDNSVLFAGWLKQTNPSYKQNIVSFKRFDIGKQKRYFIFCLNSNYLFIKKPIWFQLLNV